MTRHFHKPTPASTLNGASTRRRLRRLGTLVVCALGISMIAAAPSVKENFEHLNLVYSGAMWVNSGVWKSGADNSLLLVDALNSRIREFQVDFGKRNFTSAEDIPDKGRPSIIRPVGKSYILQTDATRFVTLSENLDTVASVDIMESSKGGPEGQICSAYAWAPLGKDLLLTFSDVLKSDGTWTSAFLRVPLRDPSKFVILDKMPVDSPMKTYYLLGYPYVAATAAGKGYYIKMGAEPQLYEVGQRGYPIPIVTEETRALLKETLPELPKKKGQKDLDKIYEHLQNSTLPAGLYGDNDLYLLKRSGAEWTLARFDSEARTFMAPFKVPTSAAHLTVIPGQVFAFLEKGPVKGLGDQAIPTVLLIPKKAIDSYSKTPATNKGHV